MVLAGAVAAVVVLGGAGAYLYPHQNSAANSPPAPQLALEQHDPSRAIDYLRRAIDKHPSGDTGIALRVLAAHLPMMEAGREPWTRTYLQQALSKSRS